MYTTQEPTDEFNRVNMRSKELVAQILTHLTPERTKFKISSNQEIFSHPDRKGKIFFLVDGTLQYVVNNKILFHFDPGDLVGVEHYLCDPAAKVVSDFAVIVDQYDAETILKTVAQNNELQRLWSQYLVQQFTMLTVISSTLMSSATEAPPEIRAFGANDPITLQGTPADEVFILVEGELEASINGTPVGEINIGEIFGLLPAITDLPRVATITSITNSMVLVIPKARVKEWIEGQGHEAIKMVEDMVKTLNSLNDRVSALGLSKF